MTPKLSPSFFTSATVCLPSEPITLPHPQPGMPSPHLGAGAVCMCDGPQSDLASGGCERSRWVRAGPFCGWESPTSAAGWAFAFRRKIWLSLASRPKISHHSVCFNLGFFGKTAEGHPAVFQAPPFPCCSTTTTAIRSRPRNPASTTQPAVSQVAIGSKLRSSPFSGRQG